MTHWAAIGGSEADSKPLTVGDLTFMPGKLDHISKCCPSADCITVSMQKGKSDFIPAKAPKAPAEAPGMAPPAAAPAAAKPPK